MVDAEADDQYRQDDFCDAVHDAQRAFYPELEQRPELLFELIANLVRCARGFHHTAYGDELGFDKCVQELITAPINRLLGAFYVDGFESLRNRTP